MTRRFFLLGIGCLAGLYLGAGSPSLAQQGSSPEEGGPVLTFGLSSTLSTTDNYNLHPLRGDSATLFDSRLSFGYRDRRANDVLHFDLNGLLRASEPPGGSNTFDNRSARLGYDREGVNSALSLGADYTLTSVSALDPFDDTLSDDDPLDESDLTQDRGHREQLSARFSFETGLNDPLGFALDGRYRKQTFSGTSDPGLFDTRILNLSATTRLTLSPVTQARVVLRFEDYSAEDSPRTDRQTSSANVGLNHALSAVDTFDVSLGLQQIRTHETILGIRRPGTESGVIGSLALTRELKRGSIGTTFDLRESVNGTTATWMVDRAMTLPRGALEISIGVTKDAFGTISPVGQVDFTHEMVRSTLTASIERQVRTSSRSNELRTTRASLGYRHEINSLSDVAFSANFANLSRVGDPAMNDITRADLRATYSHYLTRDWRLSSGYEYRIRDEDTRGSASSNRVFLTIDRNFVLRP